MNSIIKPQKDQKKQLLHDALAAFTEETGVQTKILKLSFQLPEGFMDAKIQLGNNPPYIVEIKQTIRPVTLGTTIVRLKRIPKPAILVTNYITPPLAKKLKEMDIQFIDVAGNIYLKTEKVLIYMVGHKEVKKSASGTIRVFRATGLKVIFALLNIPNLINSPYREIANKAGVALGSVTNVFKDLVQLGYIYRSKKKGLVIENIQQLIEHWVDAYPRELRPQLNPQRFKVAHLDWWQETDYEFWTKNNLWLAGEPAAALLTNYIHPESVTVYGKPNFKKLAQRIQPEKNENGQFEIVAPFWNFEFEQIIKTKYRQCPPLLVYADLLLTGKARQLDAAKIILENYLDKF